MIPKRIAIIDLGTNTFNLLVAEKTGLQVNRLYSTKEGVALGLGGINQNKLTPDSIERAMITLQNFNTVCSGMNVEKIFAFGTSALRNASNAAELIDRAKNQLDLRIEVIQGAREAELIYKGVKTGYDFSTPAVIMDIGGGSTEFIWADENGVKKSQSFEIGVSRIYQLFSFSDPMSENDCRLVYEYLESRTNGFFDDIQCERLIGASGSFETFYKLAHNCEFPDDEFVQMTMSDVYRSLDQIIASTQAERDRNPLIIPIRKKMAPLAAVKTKWVLEKLRITDLVISPFALKEGVLSEI